MSKKKGKFSFNNTEKRISDISNWMIRDKNYHKIIIIFFVFTLFLQLFLSISDQSLYRSKDASIYFEKANEILNGDFKPKLESNMGLPLLEGGVLFLFGSKDIHYNIFLIKILAGILGSLVFIPFFMISNRFFDKKTTLIALLFFVTQTKLIIGLSKPLNEAPYIFLMLFSLYFLMISFKNKKYLIHSSICVGLSYYFKAYAFVMIFVIFVYIWINRKKVVKLNYKWVVWILLTFLFVITPKLVLRTNSYGNPLDYGTNSRVFADNLDQIWDKSDPYWTTGHKETVSDYLRTHNTLDIVKRSVLGLGWSLHDFLFTLLNPVIVFLLFFGLLINMTKKNSALHVTYIFWFLLWFWIYPVYPFPRYLMPLIPISLILAANALEKVCQKAKHPNLFMISILFFYLLTLFAHLAYFFVKIGKNCFFTCV